VVVGSQRHPETLAVGRAQSSGAPWGDPASR
jgi:hypothetical protein